MRKKENMKGEDRGDNFDREGRGMEKGGEENYKWEI